MGSETIYESKTEISSKNDLLTFVKKHFQSCNYVSELN